MTKSNRDPSSAPVNAARVGGMVGLIGLSLAHFYPSMEMTEQQLITGAIVAVSGYLGKEFRNYQHTFMPGEKRAEMIQSGLAEVVLGFLGRVL